MPLLYHCSYTYIPDPGIFLIRNSWCAYVSPQEARSSRCRCVFRLIFPLMLIGEVLLHLLIYVILKLHFEHIWLICVKWKFNLLSSCWIQRGLSWKLLVCDFTQSVWLTDWLTASALYWIIRNCCTECMKDIRLEFYELKEKSWSQGPDVKNIWTITPPSKIT